MRECGSIVLTALIMPAILASSEASRRAPLRSRENLQPVQPEYFDLSYDLDESTIFFPGQRFEFEVYKDILGFNRTQAGNVPYWYAAFSMCMGEHGGTHGDAPYHYNKAGWKLNEIPQDRLVDVPTTVIDVEHYVFSLPQPDEFDLEVYFGWDNSTTNESPFHFPAVSPATASWLVKERQIYGLATDSPAPERDNRNPIVHISITASQGFIIENVANLDYLLLKTRHSSRKQCDLRLIIQPIKTRGTGGPTRILAYCKQA